MLLFDPSWGGPHQRAQPGAAQEQPRSSPEAARSSPGGGQEQARSSQERQTSQNIDFEWPSELYEFLLTFSYTNATF